MELSLFPLNSVLFPGTTLPLHIFEERYKLMIGRCLESKSPIGVLLIRSGNEVGKVAEPFEMGTTARIVRVQHLEEGRMNLVCLGEQRFRLSHNVSETPYLVGEVELLQSTDAEGAEVKDLGDTVAALFGEYYRLYLAISNQWTRQIAMPEVAGELADFVASRLAVSIWTKQQLLEELSVRRRLEMEMETLSDAIREMTPKVDAARAQRWRTLGVMN
ncbi:MAG: LON peptidase substrate-binding domain-containing protein [Chloroflexi bacterium]|nr:LON peptidase substrate-binding domain-containing protein [Chloroflexota bacterium]